MPADINTNTVIIRDGLRHFQTIDYNDYCEYVVTVLSNPRMLLQGLQHGYAIIFVG